MKLGKGRIEALSDGVFSIAMTLLVLELKVPELSHHATNDELLAALAKLRPSFLTFFITFMISGTFWFLHHLTFHFVKHMNQVLCWINLFFLMFVSLLPFSAGLLGHFAGQHCFAAFLLREPTGSGTAAFGALDVRTEKGPDGYRRAPGTGRDRHVANLVHDGGLYRGTADNAASIRGRPYRLRSGIDLYGWFAKAHSETQISQSVIIQVCKTS